MKRLVLLFFTCLCLLNAKGITVNGINYNILTTVPPIKVAVASGSYSGDIVIPPSIEYAGQTCTVTKIADAAFRSSNNLTSVTLPSTIDTIEAYAFGKCRNLTSVSLQEGIKYMGIGVFDECILLSSINIPTTVEAIGTEIFRNCSTLVSVTIPDNVTLVPMYSFQNCVKLKSVTLPSGVKHIGEYAFNHCKELESINLPSSITNIDKYAFSWCKMLSNVVLPSSLDRIETYAFASCPIGSLYIPASVTYIAPDAFTNKNLNSIVVDPSNVTFDSRNNCNAVIKKATNDLYIACRNAFIPESVVIVSGNAFYNCDIDTITIPSTVQQINAYCFYGCTSLKQVKCLPTTPPVSYAGDPFGQWDLNVPIYVPDESLWTYLQHWPGFTNILPLSQWQPWVDPTVEDIVVNISKTVCDVYVWDGDTYTTSGLYQKVYSSSVEGADSIVNLSLTVNKSYNLDTAIVATGSYTWAGTTYTESTIISYAGQTIDGCDSIVRVDLTINGDTPVVEEIVSTNPSPLYKGYGGVVTILYDPNKGNKGLKNSAHCYAHTGLLTSESHGTGDWKHIKSNWGSCQTELTKVGDKWQLTISNIYDFYGASQSEDITALAFVFYDESMNVGKTEDSGDIIIYLTEPSTGMDNISADGLTSVKILTDGKVVIVRGDAEYNVLGTILK